MNFFFIKNIQFSYILNILLNILQNIKILNKISKNKHI